MLLQLAWRNIWRNRRRTLITLSALTLGVLAIVFLHSYRESTYGELMRNITTGLVGHMQVHSRGYRETPEVSNYVPDAVTVEARLEAALPGARAERRVLGAGLGGTEHGSAGVMVMGLQPDDEGGSHLLTVTLGHGLSSTPAREAVVGRELAAELGIQPGGELVLVGQAVDGSLANDRFTVVGLADSGSSEMNASAVFLHLADAQDFFGLGDGVHEIVVHLPTDDEDVSRQLSAARAALDVASLEALPWNELLPELRATMEQKRKSQHFIDFIVFLIVALGALNAMTMATFERTREFGVLLSLGTRPGRLLALVLTESLLQGLLGLLAGLGLALGLLYGIGQIDFSSLAQTDMMGVRMPSIIPLRVQWQAVANAAVTVGATMLAGGLLPAFRASRLKPAEAARYV